MRSSKPSHLSGAKGLPRTSTAETRVHVCCGNCDAQLGVYENRWLRLTSTYIVAKKKGTHFGTIFSQEENKIPSGTGEKKLVEGCTVSEAKCRKCDWTIGQICIVPGSTDSESLVGSIFYRSSKIRLVHITSREVVEPIFDSLSSVSPAPSNNTNTAAAPHASNASQLFSNRFNGRHLQNGYHNDSRHGADIPIDPALEQGEVGFQGHEFGGDNGVVDGQGADPIIDPRMTQTILQRLTQHSVDIRRVSGSLEKLQVQISVFSGLLEDIRDTRIKSTVEESALVNSMQETINGIKKADTDGSEVERLEVENQQLKKRLESLAEAMGSALAKSSASPNTADARRLSTSSAKAQALSLGHSKSPSADRGNSSNTSSPNVAVGDKSQKGESTRLRSGAVRRAPWKPGTAPGPNLSGTKRKRAEQIQSIPAKRASSLRNEVRPEHEHDHNESNNERSLEQQNDQLADFSDEEPPHHQTRGDTLMSDVASFLNGIEAAARQQDIGEIPVDPALLEPIRTDDGGTKSGNRQALESENEDELLAKPAKRRGGRRSSAKGDSSVYEGGNRAKSQTPQRFLSTRASRSRVLSPADSQSSTRHEAGNSKSAANNIERERQSQDPHPDSATRSLSPNDSSKHQAEESKPADEHTTVAINITSSSQAGEQQPTSTSDQQQLQHVSSAAAGTTANNPAHTSTSPEPTSHVHPPPRSSTSSSSLSSTSQPPSQTTKPTTTTSALAILNGIKSTPTPTPLPPSLSTTTTTTTNKNDTNPSSTNNTVLKKEKDELVKEYSAEELDRLAMQTMEDLERDDGGDMDEDGEEEGEARFGMYGEEDGDEGLF